LKKLRILYAPMTLLVITVLSLSHSVALAARCQVGNVTYSIPQQAAPAQRIETATTVDGSCVSDGEDYYSVRVDLVDAPSSSIVSSNSTPIGYDATNFTVTVENIATTPSNNGTWYIDVDVYVIRAGGTSGSYLLDYHTSSNATIQIGAPTPVPEYSATAIFTLTIGFWVAVTAVWRRKRGAPKNWVKVHW
jgi:hypothetical protein